MIWGWGVADEATTTNRARLELRNLSVRNLRSLQDLPPAPIEPDLTILAGQNGGGKTSFLDALSMLIDSHAPSEEARSSEDEDITVTGFFRATDDADSVTVRATHSSGRVRREVLSLVHPAFGDAPTSMPLQALRDAFESADIKSPGGRAKAPFVEAADQWIAQRPSTDLTERWLSLPADTADRLPDLTPFRSQDADDQLGRVARLITQQSQRVLSTDSFTPRLADIADEIQEVIEPVLEVVKETIKSYCPGVDEVDIDATFDFSRISPQVQLHLKTVSGDSISIEQAGSGLLQRVGLAIYAANLASLQAAGADSKGALLAYDEPDTHLDYQGQRELFDIIRDQADLPHVQVLVATHSANLIDKVPFHSLRHFRVQDQRTIVDVPSDYGDEGDEEFADALASGLGPRNSVLLGEKCFLVVEGPTEDRALPTLFRKLTGQSLASAGITLLNTGGSGGVRRLVEVLIQRLRRTVVVLVDEDARKGRARINAAWLKRSQLEEGKNAFFAGTKEFEDAFDDKVWLRVAVERFPVDDGPAWQLGDFADARAHKDGMGKALENLLSRRLHRPVTKPEVGEALALTATGEEIPEVICKAVSAAFNFAKEA